MLDDFAIEQDLDLLKRDEPARHHRIENRQKRLDLVVGVDDQSPWQILGKPQDFRGEEPGRLTEAHRTVKDGCSGEMSLARLEAEVGDGSVPTPRPGT